MDLELVGKCSCNCSESSCNDCLGLIYMTAIAAILLLIAIVGYKAYSKYLETKLKMAEDERELKREERGAKIEWEKHLDDILTDRKKEDLELRIKEFTEITYPAAILSKVDNKRMTAEEVVSNIEDLMSKVKKIEDNLTKEKKQQ